MQKITPILAILVIVGLLGSNFAYADYTEWIGLRVPQSKPNICIFEAEDPDVNFTERNLYGNTIKWIQRGWIDKLNEFTGTENWNVTYEFIPNATHYDKKLYDFPQCHIMIVFDAENLLTNDLANAQGYTGFDYKKSSHKFAVIDIFTWAPTTTINLGAIDLGDFKQNKDGSYEIPLGEVNFEQKPISNEAVRVVVQHEFGHAIGLGHYFQTLENNYDSIMIPRLDFRSDDNILKAYQTTRYDMEAMTELYGKGGFKEWNHQPIPEHPYGWVKSVTKGTNPITGVFEIHFPEVILNPLK